MKSRAYINVMEQSQTGVLQILENVQIGHCLRKLLGQMPVGVGTSRAVVPNVFSEYLMEYVLRYHARIFQFRNY